MFLISIVSFYFPMSFHFLKCSGDCHIRYISWIQILFRTFIVIINGLNHAFIVVYTSATPLNNNKELSMITEITERKQKDPSIFRHLCVAHFVLIFVAFVMMKLGFSNYQGLVWNNVDTKTIKMIFPVVLLCSLKYI